MANWVRISTIAAPSIHAEHGYGQPAVDAMIRRWRDLLVPVLHDRPDLIVVPECCDGYAGWSREQAEAYYQVRGNQVRDVFSELAGEHRCHIAYAAVRRAPDGTWRNSIQFLGRDGSVLGTYDKCHPVIFEMTDHGIVPGDDAPLIQCDFGTIGGLICFDLNFEPIRERYRGRWPDLLVFSSMYHGGLMLNYWAYASRRHLVTAVAGLPSGVFSPVGELLATTTNYFRHVTASVNLDCVVAHLDENWERLESLRAKYGPDVTIHDPGYLGAVLVSSNARSVTAAQMASESKLELLDDYLARSIACQNQHRATNRR